MGTLVAEVAELGLVPQQTSEIASEVELAPQAELNIVITFAAAFKSFNQSLTPEVKAAAGRLKEAFGVRQGYQGRTMIVEGREMEWKAFVDRYFGITPRRFNQILEIEDETASPKPRKTNGSGSTSEVADLGEKFEELDREYQELTQKFVDMSAQLDDPVKLCVVRWREREPEDVQAELNRIIGDLNLGDCLKVELY
jgi:hypothetical protein